MQKIKSVCVYCGASMRVDQIYKETASEIGTLLAEQKFQVVFGGGKLGLMGIVADHALKKGGRVVGVIPQLLEDFEGAHPGLSELHVVDTMHTRKKKMSDIADAFVILPGGFGTLDELFEIMTWKQLQMHNKPVIVLNVDGYWNPLQKLIHNVIEHQFAPANHALLVKFVETPNDAMKILQDINEN